ncbi:MAG TPA: BrnA antitoxin family protein [Bauldia sp.]|nr:BrnA antitoxin family protein [Bauldia sp.]
MVDPPRRRTIRDPREAAEAAFRAVKAPPPLPTERRNVLPGVKEQVTLRIEREVLEFFQKDGPGWQERIEEALRQAAGMGGSGAAIEVDKLNASNDE